MHGRCFEQILTGTALALVLGLSFAAPAAAQGTAAADQSRDRGEGPASRARQPPAADAPPTSPRRSRPPARPRLFCPTRPIFRRRPSRISRRRHPPRPLRPPSPAPAAAAPATPAPPAAVVDADQPIRDALREFVGSNRLARVIDKKSERTAVEAFYASRDYAPMFVGIDGATERGKQTIAHLRNADADGMDPNDYPVPSIQAGSAPAAMADAEMRLVESVLDYARHAQMGRMHYSRVSADIFYEQTAPAPLDVLSKLAAGKAADVLGSYQPPQAAYKALRKKLAEVRGRKGDAPEAIARGPVLELSTDKRTKQTVLMSDERVPALREKLGLAAVRGDNFYDKPLADAVAQYQKEKGLSATGKLTQQTVDALNGKRHEKDDQIIIANMERWRWIPRDLGKAHVVLNIPDFSLRVYNNGATIWQTRVVVGKPATPTPLLTETMKYITVNPTWNVPPSIVYNEYLPALQQDPTVLKRMGLKLEQRPDGSVHISQPPGEANALGRVRFNFPNKFLVYQHDTPDKHLFAHSKRAYSHGCMRVQDPTKYAEIMTGLGMPGSNYSADKIKSMFGHSEIDLRFTQPDPGAHHLPDGVRGRRRPPADPRRPVWPGCPAARRPEGRPPSGRNPGRASPAELQPPVGTAAQRGRERRLFGRPVVLRPAVR